MHTTLMEVSCVVPEPNRLDPMNYLVIGPDQHIWRVGAEKEQRQVWPRPLQGWKWKFLEPQSTLFVLAPTHSHPPQLSTSSFCPPWHLSSWRTSPYHSILARLQVQANRLSPQSPCIRHPLSLGRNGPFLSLSTFRVSPKTGLSFWSNPTHSAKFSGHFLSSLHLSSWWPCLVCGVGTVAADWAGAVSSPTEGSILWAEPVSPSRLCLPSQVWISSLPTARGRVPAAGPRPPRLLPQPSAEAPLNPTGLPLISCWLSSRRFSSSFRS